jgi:hypothetical protein
LKKKFVRVQIPISNTAWEYKKPLIIACAPRI